MRKIRREGPVVDPLWKKITAEVDKESSNELSAHPRLKNLGGQDARMITNAMLRGAMIAFRLLRPTRFGKFPKKAGFYWFRKDKNFAPVIVLVGKTEKTLRAYLGASHDVWWIRSMWGDDTDYLDRYPEALFCGPLPGCPEIRDD